jgi:hypothetical protein
MLQIIRPHYHLNTVVLILALLASSCRTADYREFSVSDSSIDNIILTATELASMGPRNAGTPQEESIADMIIGRMKEEKISFNRQRFEFQTFEIDSAFLVVDGETFTPDFIGMNPFNGPVDFQGEIVLYDEMIELEEGQNKLMIADRPETFFMALQAASNEFVMLSSEDYSKLKEQSSRIAHLSVKGQVTSRSSSNIEAVLGNNDSDAGAIYLTAHYDSYLESPGANDNGTGLAALLEMGSMLQQVEPSLPVNVHLVFMGAEEVGILGSRVYVNTHIEALKDCKLVINFDTFGGDEGPYIAVSEGVNSTPGEGIRDHLDPVMLNRALEGPDGKWRLLHPALFDLVMANNYPEWAQNIVDSAAKALDMEIYTRLLMSDHLSFAQAGIPAISIQSREHQIHSINDTPENMNSETIASCFLLSWEVLKKLLQANE